MCLGWFVALGFCFVDGLVVVGVLFDSVFVLWFWLCVLVLACLHSLCVVVCVYTC